MLETTTTEARLKQLFAKSSFNFLDADPQLAWIIFKDFVREPVNCAHDGVLFECGASGFTGDKLFRLGFTRQFEIEVGGQYEWMEQLHCTLLHQLAPELESVQKNLWAEQFENLDEYFEAVENLPEFQVCMQQRGWICEIEQGKI